MKTRIPIEKYVPDERAVMNMNTVFRENYSDDDPILIISREYGRLLKHHQEETEFLIHRIEQLESGMAWDFSDVTP